jgi:hypothetical protein
LHYIGVLDKDGALIRGVFCPFSADDNLFNIHDFSTETFEKAWLIS